MPPGRGRVKFSGGGGTVKTASATDGTKARDNSTFHWFAQGGGGGELAGPNEPAGFIPICYHGFDVLPGLDGGGLINYSTPTGGKFGGWWRDNGNGSQDASVGGNLSLGTNGGGGPLTDTYLSVKYPQGLHSGTGPCFFIGWNPQTPLALSQQTELYIYVVLRYRGVAGDGQGSDVWGFEPTLNKIWYVPYMNQKRVNHGTIGARAYPNPGAQQNSVYSNDWRFEPRWTQVTKNHSTLPDCVDPSGGAAKGFENQGQPPFLVNDWVAIETYQKQNTLTCPGTDDGIFKMWGNNVLRSNYTDMRWCSSFTGGVINGVTYPPSYYGFYQFRFAPVYGGVNNYDKERDDYLDIAHVYCSGKEGPD